VEAITHLVVQIHRVPPNNLMSESCRRHYYPRGESSRIARRLGMGFGRPWRNIPQLQSERRGVSPPVFNNTGDLTVRRSLSPT
jgi:hypothetical protein